MNLSVNHKSPFVTEPGVSFRFSFVSEEFWNSRLWLLKRNTETTNENKPSWHASLLLLQPQSLRSQKSHVDPKKLQNEWVNGLAQAACRKLYNSDPREINLWENVHTRSVTFMQHAISLSWRISSHSVQLILFPGQSKKMFCSFIFQSIFNYASKS